MTYTPPCGLPEADPEDWFIEKNGRQYRDAPVEISEGVVESVKPDENGNRSSAKLVAEQIRVNLIKRRKAREACYSCRVRLQCLDLGMGDDEFGTFGGYYPEERQEINRLMRERESI